MSLRALKTSPQKHTKYPLTKTQIPAILYIRSANSIKIKQEKNTMSEEEIRRSFRVFLDKGGCLNVHFFHSFWSPKESTERARILQADVQDILESNPGQNFSVIIDLPLSGSYVSGPARMIYSDMAAYPQFERFAIIGESDFFKMVAKLALAGSVDKERFSFFSYREDALEWIVEDKQKQRLRPRSTGQV